MPFDKDERFFIYATIVMVIISTLFMLHQNRRLSLIHKTLKRVGPRELKREIKRELKRKKRIK